MRDMAFSKTPKLQKVSRLRHLYVSDVAIKNIQMCFYEGMRGCQNHHSQFQ